MDFQKNKIEHPRVSRAKARFEMPVSPVMKIKDNEQPGSGQIQKFKFRK